MARPTKLNAETHAAIIKALSIGATRKDAAEAAGVVYTTFLDWMKAGETTKSGKFYEFYNDVVKTEAQTRINFTTVVAKAANNGSYRAAIEFLRRRDRANWGDSVDVTSQGQAVKGYTVLMNPDQWEDKPSE
jgi:hypothetical protein